MPRNDIGNELQYLVLVNNDKEVTYGKNKIPYNKRIVKQGCSSQFFNTRLNSLDMGNIGENIEILAVKKGSFSAEEINKTQLKNFSINKLTGKSHEQFPYDIKEVKDILDIYYKPIKKDNILNRKKINYSTISINEIITKKSNNDFTPIKGQRNIIWNNSIKTSFLNNLLLGKDIGNLKVYIRNNNKYEIIDGNNRITTLTDFKNNQLLLNLKYISNKEKWSNNLYYQACLFKSLHENIQDEFLKILIPCTIYKESCGWKEKDVRKEFINTNSKGQKVNTFEIQDAEYYGTLSKFLDKIVKDEYFILSKIFKNSDISRKRSKDFISRIIIQNRLNKLVSRNELNDFRQHNININDNINLSLSNSINNIKKVLPIDVLIKTAKIKTQPFISVISFILDIITKNNIKLSKNLTDALIEFDNDISENSFKIFKTGQVVPPDDIYNRYKKIKSLLSFRAGGWINNPKYAKVYTRVIVEDYILKHNPELKNYFNEILNYEELKII